MTATNVPEYQMVLFLRGIISSDYNTTRNNVSKMIWKDLPRKDITKNSYPRISIVEVTETGDAVAIGQKTATENIYVCQIDIWIWDKPDDTHLLTVGGNVVSGTRARDEIAREVLYKMRNNFYSDTNMSGYYDYRIRAVRTLPFDENIGILRKQIEIEFKEMDTST